MLLCVPRKIDKNRKLHSSFGYRVILCTMFVAIKCARYVTSRLRKKLRKKKKKKKKVVATIECIRTERISISIDNRSAKMYVLRNLNVSIFKLMLLAKFDESLPINSLR